METLVSFFGEYMWAFWLLFGLGVTFLLVCMVLFILVVVDFIRY